MKVIKHQSFDVGVRVVTLQCPSNVAKFSFVQNFISFKVERPVTRAGVLSDHLLLGVNEAAVCHAFVPSGFNDANLGLFQGTKAVKGVISALANSDHEFIDQRKQ